MTTSELRASLILQVRAGQITAQEAARQLGISRQAYYKWEQRALRALLQSLEDQPKGRPPSKRDSEKEQLQSRVRELERQVRLHEERDQIRTLLKQMEEPDAHGSSTKKKLEMIPRILERLDQARREFTWTELCQGLLPCATVLRWKSRARAGEPLLDPPGPKKPAPLDAQTLRQKIRELQHGPRRTAGTTALREELKDEISRRRFQEMVAEERRNRKNDMKRIYWLKPGAAWSLDTTEYGPEKMKITPLRDLASKYQVPTPLVAPEENGERIALYLDRIFRQEGAPVFLKRDLGSPLNCQALDQVLERHWVLPLNSPPAYPQYNGSIERSMRDLKDALDERRMQSLIKGTPRVLEVELVTH